MQTKNKTTISKILTTPLSILVPVFVVSSLALAVTTIGTNIVTEGDLTIDTNTLYVDSTNNRVGIGTTTPTQKLDVNGTVQATAFIGDGSGLTDITGAFSLGGKVHTVCSSGCDYSSVGSAVSGASSGDTILIDSGNYSQSPVLINKNLSIIGLHNPTITGTDYAVFSIVEGATVTIEGLTIYGKPGEGRAIENYEGTVEIRNCTVYGGKISNAIHQMEEDATLLIIRSSHIFGGAGYADNAGRAIQTDGGTFYMYDSTATGGNDHEEGGDAGDAVLLAGTGYIWSSILTGGTYNYGSGHAGVGLRVYYGTANVYDSRIVASGTDAIKLDISGTLNISGSYIGSSKSGEAAIDVSHNTATVNVYQCVLDTAGSPSAAVLCVSGTTVSVASSAADVTMVEAGDCTNNIGTPYNVVDSDVP